MRRLKIAYGVFVTLGEFAVAFFMYRIGWMVFSVFYICLGIVAARITWDFRRTEPCSQKTERSGL